MGGMRPFAFHVISAVSDLTLGRVTLYEVPFNKECFNLLSMQAAAIAFIVIIEIFRKSLGDEARKSVCREG